MPVAANGTRIGATWQHAGKDQDHRAEDFERADGTHGRVGEVSSPGHALSQPDSGHHELHQTDGEVDRGEHAGRDPQGDTHGRPPKRGTVASAGPGTIRPPLTAHPPRRGGKPLSAEATLP